MKNVETIKDFYGRIVGKIETDHYGNKVVRDFYGRILGKYDKRLNVTRDFHGKIVARGDQVGLLFSLTSKVNS